MKNLRWSALAFAAFGLGFVFAGCASAAKAPAVMTPLDVVPAAVVDLKALDNAEPTRVVTRDFEYVRVTGSLIPVRVPKGANTRPLPGANPVTNMSPEDFERLVQRGMSGRP
jgi:hypothetical protein